MMNQGIRKYAKDRQRLILSFKDEETREVFSGTVCRNLPPDIQNTARRKLRLLDSVETLNDLRSPAGNRLEALKRGRVGQHSIRVNDQWRICFIWTEAGVEQVEIVDYH